MQLMYLSIHSCCAYATHFIAVLCPISHLNPNTHIHRRLATKNSGDRRGRRTLGMEPRICKKSKTVLPNQRGSIYTNPIRALWLDNLAVIKWKKKEHGLEDGKKMIKSKAYVITGLFCYLNFGRFFCMSSPGWFLNYRYMPNFKDLLSCRISI